MGASARDPAGFRRVANSHAWIPRLLARTAERWRSARFARQVPDMALARRWRPAVMLIDGDVFQGGTSGHRTGSGDVLRATVAILRGRTRSEVGDKKPSCSFKTLRVPAGGDGRLNAAGFYRSQATARSDPRGRRPRRSPWRRAWCHALHLVARSRSCSCCSTAKRGPFALARLDVVSGEEPTSTGPSSHSHRNQPIRVSRCSRASVFLTSFASARSDIWMLEGSPRRGAGGIGGFPIENH